MTLSLASAAPSASAGVDELRSAVAAAPDDLSLRRVFADALTDRGDPRGEFIMIQLERLRPELGADVHQQLDARAQALLSEHQAQWLPVDLTGVEVQFRAGFVAHITIADPLSFDRLAPLFEREPVTSLRLLNHRGLDLARLAALPWTERLKRLSLARLSLRALALSSQGLQPLIDSRRLRGLAHLEFIGHSFGDDGALVLAANVPHAMPSLTALTLSDCDLTEVGARALATEKWLGALRSLDLSANGLGPAGVDALAFARSPGHLASLVLDRTRMGDEGAKSLARAPRLASLRALSATHARIGGVGCQALLESPSLQRLEVLSLRGNAVGRKLEPVLQQRFPLSGLR